MKADIFFISSVAAKYEKGMKAGHEEINELAQDLKRRWKTISHTGRAAKRQTVKKAGK